MATRGCTKCGPTFDNDENTVETAIVVGCTHAGHLQSIIILSFLYYIIIIIIIIIILIYWLIQNTALYINILTIYFIITIIIICILFAFDEFHLMR